MVEGDRVTLADFGTLERKPGIGGSPAIRVGRTFPIVVPEWDLPAFTPGKEFRHQVLGNSD